MEQRLEVADFLRSRRDRITPERAGIIKGGRRRVPGLRREEVAMLTGVSVEYYARMERGDLAGVSLEVLDALASALQLEPAEFDHLRDLARAAGPRPPHRRRTDRSGRVVKPELQRFLDAVTGVPVWVRDRRLDFIAANPLGRALYAVVLDDPVSEGNAARFTFLNPAARDFFPDWEENAESVVATLRMYVGRYPSDERLNDLIDELNDRSDAFRALWPEHNVRHHRLGVKRIRHPEVGMLVLSYQVMNLPANPDWFVFTFTPEEGSPTEERLKVLAGRLASGQPIGVGAAGC